MIIERKQYLDKLISYKDKRIIKIVTGIRRCGKSTLLKMYVDFLLSNCKVANNHIIYINFEDLKNEDLQNYKTLYNHLNNLLIDNDRYYIVLDEIQNVENFQKAIDSIYLKDNVDIYITGSNAYMLSSEIATLLSGRYVQIEMLPLSFTEYMMGRDEKEPSMKLFNEYIENSSFPQVLDFINQKDQVREYIDNLFNSIIVKDILRRNKISDAMMLNSILRFIFDSIGSSISIKKIADTLNSNGRKIDNKTVEKYISFMLESYIIYQIKRYDIKGHQHLATQEKYYIVDIGFRHMLIGNKKIDIGHILENVVFLELYRRGYNVYIGKVGDKEVDFVVVKNNELKYIQVALTIRDENTYLREIAPLKQIKDNYEKIILTLDDDIDQNDEGIKIINAVKWLVNY